MNIRNLLASFVLIAFAGLTNGCKTGTYTVVLNPDTVRTTSVRREGAVAIQFKDQRADKESEGRIGGRIFNNPLVTVRGGLEDRLTDIFGEVLEQSGYRVESGAPALLEGEVREFWVRADGWTQGATERIRLRLRNKGGKVLWERAFKGEDGGMDLVPGFAEKSMNVAMSRLLKEVAEEFTSESFYQAVKSAGAGRKAQGIGIWT